MTAMAMAAKTGAEETKEEAYPPKDAADRVAGATSGDTNRVTLSRARYCKVWSTA
jgi:hypothetical protein